MDLAEGHVAALKYIESSSSNPTTIFTSTTPSTTSPDTSTTSGQGFGQYSVFNLGTGIGYSVLEMVEAMKLASNRPLPYEFGLRRPGDIAICYADPTKAKELLG